MSLPKQPPLLNLVPYLGSLIVAIFCILPPFTRRREVRPIAPTR
jgi:hypothetical protein